MDTEPIYAEDVEVCPKCGSTEFWENRIICVGDDPTAERSGTQSSIAENSGTKWIANAERALGLHYLLENGVTPNAYYKLLLELGASRKAASEHRKEMFAMQLVADDVNLYDQVLASIECKVCGAVFYARDYYRRRFGKLEDDDEEIPF